jgi:uncharacterized cupredoxin-like copper-binding protein
VSTPSGPAAAAPGDSPRPPSRAPVYVTLGGLALALTLVFLAAGAAVRTAPPPPIERAGTADAPRDVTIILREYAFAPAPLALIPGETVRLTILDGGLIPHELVLGDASVQAAWASADAAATPPVPFATAPPASVPAGTAGLRILLDPGGQAVVTYVVPAAGPLSMECHLPNHLERGMLADVVLTRPTTGAR